MELPVTAIIVNYNTSKLCASAIESLLKRFYPRKIVVVDNSCEKREAHFFLRYQKKLGKLLDVIVPSKNLGFAKACNIAFRAWPSDFILLLNPDAYLLDDCLVQLVDFLLSNKNIGAVVPRTFLDDNKQVFLPPMPRVSLWDIVAEGVLGAPYIKVKQKRYLTKAISFWQAKFPLEQVMLSGGIVLIRKEAITDVGGLFDERFFMYFEDTDFFERLRQKRWQLFMLPTAHGVHHYDQSPSRKKDAYFKKSKELYLKKHYPMFGNLLKRLSSKKKKAGTKRFFIKNSQPVSLKLTEDKPCFFIFSPNESLIPCGGIKVHDNFFIFPRDAWGKLRSGQIYYYDFLK